MKQPDGEWLDRMYNARAQVPGYPAHFKRWADDSAHALLSARCELDLNYGAGPNEQLDIFRPDGRGAPVLVFIHGGYWRSLDKRDHAFIAPAFTREGVCVVIPNYALCPAVTIPDIVLQLVRALAWTWRHIERFGGDPGRITVAGHSAGGHLAAMTLACLWRTHDAALPANLVRNALSISGLLDLDPIMRTPFLQPSLNLTPAQVGRASPARLAPPARGELYAVCGGDESEEFHRQMSLIRDAWGAARVPACESLAGLNHFSVLEALGQPGHRLHQLALKLLKA
ncbi:alpha/beta hydrolase [Ramlibacter solisilvae]|uniref:Esterase n=1 Tax=Ramlibacter tataouinensis TaxID=94132 RepID=A0A127JX22_9BURK|nr:alpha/beta hydrolase [Ramlibacter tataouinensis]AMO24423.1 esterase [Ramlibacter tataouinensis]